MANAIISTLIFDGSIAGQTSIQSQPIGGNLIFQLPNIPPIQGQLMTAQAINGSTVVMGWSSAQSLSNIPLSALAQSGATTGQVIEWNGSAWVASTGVPGAGTVTSVALTAPVEFTVGGSPITTSGTLAITKANQSANTVWAGPTTGAAAPPAFRALVAADIGSNTVSIAAINSKEGTGSKVQLTNAGATVSGDVVTYDGSGNVQDSGMLLSSLAPLASPVFTGTVTAPTIVGSGSGVLQISENTGGVVISSSVLGKGVLVGTAASGTDGIALWDNTSANFLNVSAANGGVSIQTSGTGNISLQTNAVTGTNGNVALDANLHVTSANADVKGTITVTNPATSQTFSFARAYASAPTVVVTPKSDPSVAGIVAYWVTSTGADFTVHVNTTPGTSIAFNYHVIG